MVKVRASKRSGFTLIELLVVLSIISLLSSVVLSSLNSARSKARDARRLEDMRSVRNALEVYRNDNPGYPNTSGNWWGVCSSFGSHDTGGSNGYIPNLAPTYISALPTDPRPTGPGTCYLYRSDGIDFMFLAYMTVENLPIRPTLLRPAYPTEPDYAMYTPGGSSW